MNSPATQIAVITGSRQRRARLRRGEDSKILKDPMVNPRLASIAIVAVNFDPMNIFVCDLVGGTRLDLPLVGDVQCARVLRDFGTERCQAKHESCIIIFNLPLRAVICVRIIYHILYLQFSVATSKSSM